MKQLDERAVEYLGEVDSLDEMQPTPRRGKFFAEEILRPEIKAAFGVIIPEQDKDAAEYDTRPKRAKVIQLGEPPEDAEWDFIPTDEVIVPYHAGYHYTWRNQLGIEETLWILDYEEPISIFRKRRV
jgi:hypothetical protein